jgi:hypothetical protein
MYLALEKDNKRKLLYKRRNNIMEYQVKDFIYAIDEDRVLQIRKIFTHQNEKLIDAQYISSGGSRWFKADASHFRKATQEEIDDELNNAPKSYPYWIADKKDYIISNGRIKAYSLERAKEIFKEVLKRTRKEFKVGDYFMSEEPENYIMQ